MTQRIQNSDLLSASIFPSTDPLPIDSSHWAIGKRIKPHWELSEVYENGVLRADIVAFTGDSKIPILRVRKAIMHCYFSKHTQLIVNGVLMAKIHGEWQDIARIDFNPDYTPVQAPRTRKMFE